VAVAADHVSHTLIPPGGIFSFNDALGPISLDQGYVEGKIITGDWFADDLGGGVCQVSTTVYRAALLSGVPIEEWHPHSFRLGFYELDDWPPGLDAAIYQPNTPGEWELDLAFSNPTDSWMLLQMRIDADAVAADLYGDDTECHVELIGPVMGEPIAPPAPVERASADLPTGERRQIQVAQDGVRVDVTRRVRRGRELVRDATFVSDYQPQPEVWLVGE
jgi:vancomycin resistance protein YoaR